MRDIYGRTADAPAFRDAFAALARAPSGPTAPTATLQRYLGT